MRPEEGEHECHAAQDAIAATRSYEDWTARAEGSAMPYVNCALCGVVNFTVAYWSNVDGCAGCGEPLPQAGRASSPRPPSPVASASRVGDPDRPAGQSQSLTR